MELRTSIYVIATVFILYAGLMLVIGGITYRKNSGYFRLFFGRAELKSMGWCAECTGVRHERMAAHGTAGSRLCVNRRYGGGVLDSSWIVNRNFAELDYYCETVPALYGNRR